MGRKVYEIVGWVLECDFVCVQCCPQSPKDSDPVFLGDCDGSETCCECLTPLED
jgi:hypothetical protein